jgi:hypothetical protein
MHRLSQTMKEESKAGTGVRQSNGEQRSQEFITSVRCSLIVGHLEHALEYLQESLKRKAPHATKRTESQQIQPEMVQEVMLGFGPTCILRDLRICRTILGHKHLRTFDVAPAELVLQTKV